ncbi:MAG: archaeal preflagellin peptidase FlaK [Thermoplasmata archaeon]|jgi:preflagellin peptidase FlaK|nr:archaeal preflagellin peptidase FlaK [Thermoplasmata archaeon]
MALDLQVVRVVAATGMLLGAAVLDLRARRVPNRYWLPFLGLAVLLDAHAAWTMGWEAVQVPFVLAALVGGMFYAIWRVGLYGGADAKGLMVLALLAPFPIVPWTGAFLPIGLPPALDAITNGTLLVLAFPLAMAAYNLARGNLAFPALLLGVPMDLDAAEARHVYPMQAAAPGGGLAWRYWQRAGGSRAEAYAALRAEGVQRVWATPKVPLLTFVALGWLAALAVGNLALRLLPPP